MTPDAGAWVGQNALIIGVIGGLAALLGLLILIAVTAVLYAAVSILIEHLDDRRLRRQDLATCRAIDRLGTARPDHR
ncbi:hypothetical protein [Streptomyces sp. NPDC088182]|uniref:hypothetical protein n=1 Tax=Streptomyces sp. NPDC088182 TaxID=3365838 RepID=UPI00382FF250